MDSLAWTRDGSAVVYDRAAHCTAAHLSLARRGRRDPPARAHRGRGRRRGAPAMALSRDRLAFTRVSSDADIYRFEVGRPVQLVVGSTVLREEPRLSPDGRRLAFGSARSGRGSRISGSPMPTDQIRSSSRTGRDAPGLPFLVTRRAPDRIRRVSDDGHSHIWMIDADGGTRVGSKRRPATSVSRPGPMTGGGSTSPADQGTGRDIWRVSAGGGMPERLTRGASGPFRVRVGRWQTLVVPAEGCRFAPDGDGAHRRRSAAARGVRQKQRALAPVLKACITCRAIRAPIQPSTSWICKPVGTGASARSRNS